ncbi:MAG: hypothetical protein A2139_14870 [Desulfobacca sp. RBG_16_60_12]|nr:MAG: hypothetical protein A2139_14870 [Desulfobacca sp. RBG_16_60_12]
MSDNCYHYRIKGIPGLEGLVIESDYSPSMAKTAGYVPVLTLINPNAVLGDHTVRFPIPRTALLIQSSYAEEIEDPGIHEFNASSPFGKLQFEGRLKRDKLVVDYVQYDNAITITIREDEGAQGRTVYTQNFFGENAPAALNLVEGVLAGLADVDDLVFALKELKFQEKGNN